MLEHVFIKLPTLETERLILRKLLYSDQNNIFEYAKNPEVTKHLLWDTHENEFDTIQFLNLIYEAYNHNNPAPWGIELKSNNKIIGTVGFVNWDKDKNEMEIGYAISQKYWGLGIVTEAVNEVIKFGFEQLKLSAITSRCKPVNIGSFRVLEKSGFSFNGIIKDQLLVKGKLEDMRMYSFASKAYFSMMSNNQ